jgi:hypothetical protein
LRSAGWRAIVPTTSSLDKLRMRSVENPTVDLMVSLSNHEVVVLRDDRVMHV